MTKYEQENVKYGADSIEDLAPCYFSEAFDELDFMASDAYG